MEEMEKDQVTENRGNYDGTEEEHIRRWCALPIPYPEPKVIGRNLYYAELLLEDYAGRVSEFTAINQYLYHYFVFDERYKELAELEECISIIEMFHMEMLAKTIILLGANPRYYSMIDNQRVYWNASFVYYGNAVCDRLAADIAAEEEAIINYRKHQQLIKDPYIVNMLERIIQDEQHHLSLFSQALKKYCPGY